MKPSVLQKTIQSKLLQWFKRNRRDLPWRKTRDPYAIWVSEIMLQQTQVNTVIPYYQRFLKAFPTAGQLSRAGLSEVLKIWEGLGYYSRARNLHRAAQVVVNNFHGRIPDNLKDLLSLPGIGRSTAGAILSIAYNQPAPILDGNVKRVLSRLFALLTHPAGSTSEDPLWRLSDSLVPKNHPNAFNQALMDLGSMVCTPKAPQCLHCPLRNLCEGKALGDPERYSRKEVRRQIPHIAATAAVIQQNGKVFLQRRPLRGLLGGLWEFPNWKNEGKGTLRSRLRLRLRNVIKKEMGMDVEVKDSIGTLKQTFSHFKLTLDIYRCQPIDGKIKGKNWVSIRSLNLFPMSRIHRRIAQAI